MKYLVFCLQLCLFLTAACSVKNDPPPVKIIFDTDLGPDYDDVGALAILHAMADSGKAEILATISSNKHELVVPSIEVINTWFGRPDLPVGAPAGEGPPGRKVDVLDWVDGGPNRRPGGGSAHRQPSSPSQAFFRQ